MKRPSGIYALPSVKRDQFFMKNVRANLVLGHSVRNWVVLFETG